MTIRDDDTKAGKRAGSAASGPDGAPAGTDTPASNVAPLRKTVPCPECRRPSSREHYPFCSNRCRNIDLNRWLSGAYAIPVRDDDEDERPGDDSEN